MRGWDGGSSAARLAAGGPTLVKVVDRLRADGADDWVLAIAGLVRGGTGEGLPGLLHTVGSPNARAGSKATARTHFIRRDGNGSVRTEALAKALAHRALDYCIPRSRAREAVEEFEQTGSTSSIVALSGEARSLFTTLNKSGEGGELLLYVLLESVLGIPQILCKMPLKTSTEVHVHGSDGLHAKALEGGRLALYWGESKLHATPSSAIADCFKSVAPYLIEGLEGAGKRDILLIRDNLDTGQEELTARLMRYFMDETEESALVELRAACLVGFDYDGYPHPFEADGASVVAEVAEEIEKWHARIDHHVLKHGLESFEIDIFCVPFPSVEKFREALKKGLG